MTDQEAHTLAQELDDMDYNLKTWEATFIESMLETKHFSDAQKDKLSELETRYLML